MNIVEKIGKELAPVEREVDFEVGDTVKVHYKIIEGDRERIQIYEGIVIAINNSGVSKTFTVRRISYDVGVERTFPVLSPRIAKIEVVRKAKIRRSKLYYLRDRKGKSAKLRERLFRHDKKNKVKAETKVEIPETTEAPVKEAEEAVQTETEKTEE